MKLPSDDPFYRWQGRVPADRGALLRQRSVRIPGSVPVHAEQLVYVTDATDGRPVPISGTVLVPLTPWDHEYPRPLLSYGVGVHGLGRNHAPSHLLATGTEGELPLIERALAQGWAVAVTDGEGLGMPGPHTYGAGRVGGRSMLDIVRAAQTGVAGIDANAPVLLWGYSEGGRCAVWAAEQQPLYARELDLVAVAAGGVPTDLAAVVEAIDGGPYSGLALAVLVGLAQAHGEQRLWQILNERGRAAAEVAAQLDVVGLVLTHPEHLSTWTVRDRPWTDPAWSALLAAERNPAATPRVPVHLYHAGDDDIVPFRLAKQLAADYEAMGVTVDLVELPSKDHLSASFDGAAGAITWLGLRLDEHLATAGAGTPS